MTEQPRTIDSSDPNLQQARARLQRILWIWAALFIGMALITFFTLGQNYPINPFPWLFVGLLMILTLQPALLAVVAIVWGLSLISITPGFALVFGPDPISQIFAGGIIETLGRAVVRIILAVTAWNQFLMYRMLYGTMGSSGLPKNLPDIPEIIPNRSHIFAWGALATGAVGLIAVLVGLFPLGTQARLFLVHVPLT